MLDKVGVYECEYSEVLPLPHYQSEPQEGWWSHSSLNYSPKNERLHGLNPVWNMNLENWDLWYARMKEIDLCLRTERADFPFFGFCYLVGPLIDNDAHWYGYNWSLPSIISSGNFIDIFRNNVFGVFVHPLSFRQVDVKLTIMLSKILYRTFVSPVSRWLWQKRYTTKDGRHLLYVRIKWPVSFL